MSSAPAAPTAAVAARRPTHAPLISGRYVAARLGQAVLVLFGAFTLASVLLLILPGDGILARFADPALGLSPEQIADIRASYGADGSPVTQYLAALTGFLVGDFGFSIQTGTPVSALIAEALPSTAALAAAGFTAAVVLAVAVALGAVYGPRQIRGVIDSLPSLFVSVPVFWLGIILIQVLSFQLGWVTVVEPGPLEALILPSLTLAIPLAAPLAQVLIRSIDEVRGQSFVHVTRAKGASEAWIFIHAVLRNALIPTLTIAGLIFGELVAGAVVTETVFGRTGVGALTAQAVATRDNPVLLAVVVIATTAFVLINLIVDLLYPIIDPRLRPTRTLPTVPKPDSAAEAHSGSRAGSTADPSAAAPSAAAPGDAAAPAGAAADDAAPTREEVRA